MTQGRKYFVPKGSNSILDMEQSPNKAARQLVKRIKEEENYAFWSPEFEKVYKTYSYI